MGKLWCYQLLKTEILGRDRLQMGWNDSKQQAITKLSMDLSEIESPAYLDENIQQKVEILKQMY